MVKTKGSYPRDIPEDRGNVLPPPRNMTRAKSLNVREVLYLDGILTVRKAAIEAHTSLYKMAMQMCMPRGELPEIWEIQ